MIQFKIQTLTYINCSSILCCVNLEKDYTRIKHGIKKNTDYTTAGEVQKLSPKFKTESLLSLPPHLHN